MAVRKAFRTFHPTAEGYGEGSLKRENLVRRCDRGTDRAAFGQRSVSTNDQGTNRASDKHDNAGRTDHACTHRADAADLSHKNNAPESKCCWLGVQTFFDCFCTDSHLTYRNPPATFSADISPDQKHTHTRAHTHSLGLHLISSFSPQL